MDVVGVAARVVRGRRVVRVVTSVGILGDGDAASDGSDRLPIMAEDLGVITPDVTALRKAIDAPGMVVLQFDVLWCVERWRPVVAMAQRIHGSHVLIFRDAAGFAKVDPQQPGVVRARVQGCKKKVVWRVVPPSCCLLVAFHALASHHYPMSDMLAPARFLI